MLEKKDLEMIEKIVTKVVDARTDTIDTRFDRIDTRFDSIDTRIDKIDTRIDTTEKSIRKEIREVKNDLIEEMDNLYQKSKKNLDEAIHKVDFLHVSSRISRIEQDHILTKHRLDDLEKKRA